MAKTPPADKSPKQPNRLTVTDYNKSFLQPIIHDLSVGDTCTLTVTGEVTRLEETDTGGGGYLCELSMEPTAAKHSSKGASSGGTMADDMKRDQQKRAGQDVEDDDEDEY